MPAHKKRKGTPPPGEVREAVRELVERCGQTPAAKKLGLSRDAVVALTAGIPGLAGTLALARQGLAALPHIAAIGRERAQGLEANK
ncbi:MAG TPA: hypothetical protein PKA88_32710 [Polyangiaceae bacterium]|nr:hypothetical protein [Polyangiaceae bacterium]